MAKRISKGDDLVSSLRVTYGVTADKVADTQKYLDDIFEQMAARRVGNGVFLQVHFPVFVVGIPYNQRRIFMH